MNLSDPYLYDFQGHESQRRSGTPPVDDETIT